MKTPEFLYTPKRATELWGYLENNLIEITSVKGVYRLNSVESYIWENCNGRMTIKEIASDLVKKFRNINMSDKAEVEVIKILESWKKDNLLIINFNFLHPSSEYNNSDIYTIESNVKHAVDILLLVAPTPTPSTHRIALNNIEPIGIGYLSSFLKSHGFNVGIMNLWLEQLNPNTIKNFITQYDPKIVGISTMTENFENGVCIAEIIKEFRKNIVTIFGGSHVTFDDEKILKNNEPIDIIVRGEGEHTMLELANLFINNTGKLPNINGITYRKGEEIIRMKDRVLIKDLDSLPFPDRLTYKQDSLVGLQTSRGCPGQCIFCSAKGLSGGNYRNRSASNVIKEIEYLISKGVNNIWFLDDSLTADLKRLNLILDMIEDKGLKFKWFAESRVDAIERDPEIIKRMVSGGCVAVQFGVESGSQSILDALKKNITIEQIYNAVSLASQEGLRPKCTLLIGHPFETYDTMLETFDFAKTLIDIGASSLISAVCPYPGTNIFENPEFYDVDFKQYDYTVHSPIFSPMNTKHLSAKEIKKYQYRYNIELNFYEQRVIREQIFKLFV